MVLQGGIEPPTSSLPKRCSTTELLQHNCLPQWWALSFTKGVFCEYMLLILLFIFFFVYWR